MTRNFKKKGQVTIKAIIYDGTNFDEIKLFCPQIERLNIRAFETIGFTTSDGGLTEALTGFYVVKDNGNFFIFSPEDFALLFDNFVDENKGRFVVDQLIEALKPSALTPTQKSLLITKLSAVFIALVIGELNGARFLANALTTDAVLTAGRKSFLLGLIDEQLA